jgi:multiple sugar transport system substrate-binding protein
VTDPQRGRAVSQLAGDYLAGRITRRAFIGRLMALGLSVSAAGAVLAACTSQGAPSATPGGATTAPSTPAASNATGGCSAPPKDIAAEIRFLTGPFTENEVDVHKAIAAKFNEQYPNVTFTFKLFDWYTSRTEVQTSLAEGAHDIYHLGEADIVFYSADETALLDIGKYVNDPCFAESRAQITEIDRILGMSPYPVAVPFMWFPENALYVNLDKLRAAGFDESFVDSWDTFVEAAVKMTDPAKDEFGIGLNCHNYVEWYGRLRSAGVDWVNADLTSTSVNSPDVVKATQDMVDLFLTHKAAPPLGRYDYTTGIDAFAGGKLGMVGYDASVAGALTAREVPFEWAVLPWPPGPRSRATILNTSSYGIGQKTPNPDLAWEVLKFWSSPEVTATYAGTPGYFPSHQGAYGPEFEAVIPPQMLAARDQLIEHGVFMLAIPEAPDINARAVPQVERAYTGEISAQEAVQNVEAIVKEIMAF